MIEYMFRGQESPMTVDQLNKLALQGWELVSIVYYKAIDRYSHYFKRTKNEQ